MNSYKENIRNLIIANLIAHGYSYSNNKLIAPEALNKDDCKKMHAIAVEHKRNSMKIKLQKYETKFLNKYIANGDEVCPNKIFPLLIPVERKSELELLFRYIYAHWSIPVSAGYGRRIRYIVFDKHNEKVMGIIGLCDPVYTIKPRDEWIGWSRETKKIKMVNILDAYVLGAIPPYSNLLCGKLMALLCLSNEISDSFKQKYLDKRTNISKKQIDGDLCLITTTSALGKSSIYNRLKINSHSYWESIGFTKGSGDFQFSNGLYNDLFEYAKNNLKPSAKNKTWGKGWRNKREVIKKCLSDLNLSNMLIYHGIKREIFAAKLGENACNFLRGEEKLLNRYNWTTLEIFQAFKKRWLEQRALNNDSYRYFSVDKYRLW